MAEVRTLQDSVQTQKSTSAVRSQKTVLQYSVAGGDSQAVTWEQVTNLSDITGFNGSANMADVTRLDSESKEKSPGLQDWGQVTIALFINFKEASHKALLEAKQKGTLLQFKLTLSDGSTIEFKAYVKDFPISAKVDQYVAGSINLEITGDITVKPSTSSVDHAKPTT
ncbi:MULTISPECIES: phage tail tube protein [unclassified Caballeronia]|uniref:phage tail tube protein n=1 Tax=unclassified Caballeronia TaxID=2646786 RepID=UPI00285C929F|nr:MULTISPECIES: phage tail tube protein [unclassified Caballeronia]MDR5776569.1 phage tail tube protein [Caballeronia sp. LZ002]MDR5802496.1 phage tail tube protein [Caballeronia sp. LZ001]MDR5852000.1 phage tail tube protein [Caballeronia sp. LZ003]